VNDEEERPAYINWLLRRLPGSKRTPVWVAHTRDGNDLWANIFSFGALAASCATLVILSTQNGMFAKQLRDARVARMAIVTATSIKFEKGKPGFFKATFPFTNTGDTPATDVKWYSNYSRPLWSYCGPRDCFPNRLSAAIIGPHDTIFDWHSWLGPDDIARIKNSAPIGTEGPAGRWPEVWGWISYLDLSQTRHRTFFCFRLQWDGRMEDDEAPYYVTCSDMPPCLDKQCNTTFYDRELALDWSKAEKGPGEVPSELRRTPSTSDF